MVGGNYHEVGEKHETLGEERMTCCDDEERKEDKGEIGEQGDDDVGRYGEECNAAECVGHDGEGEQRATDTDADGAPKEIVNEAEGLVRFAQWYAYEIDAEHGEVGELETYMGDEQRMYEQHRKGREC